MVKLKNIFLHLSAIALLIGFIFASRFQLITQTFEFDYDEGLNVIKALLYSQNFALYSQIWNDQPPLFTIVLSKYFDLFGQSIFAARLLVLLFSALLVWSFFQTIRILLGTIPAAVAAFLLVTSWQFTRLSTSVMIGIPSLSLAMLSIYLLTLYKQQPRRLLLLLSGVVMGVSLQTKLFTAFLVPLMAVYLLDFKVVLLQVKEKWVSLKQSIVLWLSILFLTYGLIGLLSQQLSGYEQTLQSHFKQSANQDLVTFLLNGVRAIFYLTKQDLDYLFVALICAFVVFLKKQWDGFFPLAWLGTTLLILLIHKPVWYHHYLLLAIPVCWLSAYAVSFALNAVSKGWHRNLSPLSYRKSILSGLAVAILAGLIVATPANPLIEEPTPENQEITQRILKYKDFTQWIFADRPMYAFRAGLRAPPEIAVLSYPKKCWMF
jgi:4-amino-4-deoxy-L-arabinose transferase-like glycosyltransferase